MRGLRHRRLVVEDLIKRAERKDQNQTKACDEIEHDYSSIRRIAWPFGSRTITDFLKPSFPCVSCGIATTSGAINCAPALRKRSVTAWISFVTTVVCQCQTSLDRVSAGI